MFWIIALVAAAVAIYWYRDEIVGYFVTKD
jgi:hypothetical protein